jgi:hypothetical protein
MDALIYLLCGRWMMEEWDDVEEKVVKKYLQLLCNFLLKNLYFLKKTILKTV